MSNDLGACLRSDLFQDNGRHDDLPYFRVRLAENYNLFDGRMFV